jgi:hypothetical protein
MDFGAFKNSEHRSILHVRKTSGFSLIFSYAKRAHARWHEEERIADVEKAELGKRGIQIRCHVRTDSGQLSQCALCVDGTIPKVYGAVIPHRPSARLRKLLFEDDEFKQ